MDTVFTCPIRGCGSFYSLIDMIPMPSCQHMVARRAVYQSYWDIPGFTEGLADEDDLLPPIDVSKLDSESEIDEIIARSYEDTPSGYGDMSDLIHVAANYRKLRARDEMYLDDVDENDDDIDVEEWSQTESDTEEFFHRDASAIRVKIIAALQRVSQLSSSPPER